MVVQVSGFRMSIETPMARGRSTESDHRQSEPGSFGCQYMTFSLGPDQTSHQQNDMHIPFTDVYIDDMYTYVYIRSQTRPVYGRMSLFLHMYVYPPADPRAQQSP